jgi:hypothetical protein
MGIYAWKSKGPVTEIHYVTSKNGSDEPKDEPGAVDTKKPYAADVVRIVPSGGNYGAPFDVTLSTRTPQATIHYTIDHTDPTSSSPVYTKPIHVDTTTVVKAIAVAPNRSPSFLRFESYLIFANALETPTVVDLGSSACGSAPNAQTFAVKNHGAATTFHVDMKNGAESPFTVSGDGPLPAHGEAKIRVALKAPPGGLDALDGLSDAVTIEAGNGLHRDVGVTAIATGPAFEVIDDGEIAFRDVPVKKKSPPELVRIRSRGTSDAILNLTTSGTGGFEVAPPAVAIPVGETQAVRITYEPSGPPQATGALHVAHPTTHPGCTPTVNVKLKGVAAAP